MRVSAETGDYYDDAQKITKSIGHRTDDKFFQHLFHNGSFRSSACPPDRRPKTCTDTADASGTEKHRQPAGKTCYASELSQAAKPSDAEKQFQPSVQTFYATGRTRTAEPPYAEEHRSPGICYP